jgi:hypothetical protein
MISLDSQSIRAYRKKSGYLSLHFIGNILMRTDHQTLLAQYLSTFSFTAIFSDGMEIEFDSVSISGSSISDYDFGIEIWDVKASTVTKLTKLDSVPVKTRFGYIYGSHPMITDMEYIESFAPIIKRY